MSGELDLKRGETKTFRSNRPCKFIARASGGTVISVQLPVGAEVIIFLGSDEFNFDMDFTVEGTNNPVLIDKSV